MTSIKSFEFSGIESSIVLEKILDAVDQGATTKEIRNNPYKYLTSGKTKEIIINIGGAGLKISPEIINEMSRRGDKLAMEIRDENRFHNYVNRYGKNPLRFAFLEHMTGCPYFHAYDRENGVLKEIIKEGKMRNNGGMTLRIFKVYEEPYMYKVCEDIDDFGSEYIKGWHELVAEMTG